MPLSRDENEETQENESQYAPALSFEELMTSLEHAEPSTSTSTTSRTGKPYSGTRISSSDWDEN